VEGLAIAKNVALAIAVQMVLIDKICRTPNPEIKFVTGGMSLSKQAHAPQPR
jgi:hypothetical protein